MSVIALFLSYVAWGMFENHLYLVMSSFIKTSNIKSPKEYGLVSGKGTQPLLEDLLKLLHSAFDRNLCSCAIFFDVAKAFDTVNHKILVFKLQNYGFHEPFVALLKHFFLDRSQIVSIRYFKNAQLILKAGVLQRSILSHLLFYIFVNDISTRLSSCKILQYADDTLLDSIHMNYGQVVQ